MGTCARRSSVRRDTGADPALGGPPIRSTVSWAVATSRSLASALFADDVSGGARRGAEPPDFPVAAIDDPALPEVLAELAAARAD
jgi:hypothetical protein